MYETKRTNALKTMEKKQTKVEEINKVRHRVDPLSLDEHRTDLVAAPPSSRGRGHNSADKEEPPMDRLSVSWC